MGEEKVKAILDAARKYAPQIGPALSRVKEKQLRIALAGPLFQRILEEVSGGKPAAPRDRQAGPVSDKLDGGIGPSGTQARIMELEREGFFSEPRLPDQVRHTLRVKGYHHNRADIRMSLLRLARKKKLRRVEHGQGKKGALAYVQT